MTADVRPAAEVITRPNGTPYRGDRATPGGPAVTALDAATRGRAYVLGIDPSLTGTGVAAIAEDGTLRLAAHYGRKGRRDESLQDRLDRVHAITAEVFEALLGRSEGPAVYPRLLVIEAPSHGSVGGSAWDRAHLWWELVGMLGPEATAQVAPATRAKWATGTGRADKAAVSAAVTRLWPNVELDCSDCADALALATMAAQHLGWDVPALARHRDALAAVRWPEEVAA